MNEPKLVDINKLLSMDSKQLTGNVETIFNIRKENDPFSDASDLDPAVYELQWRSFYYGWCEGRIALLRELRNRGETLNPDLKPRTFKWECGKLIELKDE